MAKTVKRGDIILLHYTGYYKDGKVFDSTHKKNPIPVKVGAGEIIKGLEEVILGMQLGEKKTVTIEPEKGYGDYHNNLSMEIRKEKIPDDISLEIGIQLSLVDKQGIAHPVTVKKILDESVKMDANHPLAGRSLVFELEVVEIE